MDETKKALARSDADCAALCYSMALMIHAIEAGDPQAAVRIGRGIPGVRDVLIGHEVEDEEGYDDDALPF